tara:strand:+ start:411 stop:1493 length:1083 start_codon:yes stop_codon:yes gene_type:complete
MATTFKNIGSGDVVAQRSLLNEAIPITGSIVSGTYIEGDTPTNVKNYSHGMFQSVYDYPYLSSSANHIFDLTVGYASDSNLSGTSDVVQQSKKINLYTQMAQTLMGFDYTGSVQQFDEDGDLSAGGTKLKECVFVNFARLLQKDEIKKGSFTLKLGASASYGSSSATEFNSLITIQDTNAATTFKVNSPTGEYGILYGTGSTMADSTKVGLLYYQAGVAVLTGAIFQSYGVTGLGASGSMEMNARQEDFNAVLSGSAISGACDNFRHRVYDLSFNNTTELNSSVYFCRANNNEFNYSSNTTYLTASKLRVKNNASDMPVSYITTVGLYSADNELLAVAKLSEPLQKDPTTEFVLKVRLDY